MNQEDRSLGQSAVLVAIALLVLVAFAAITVDISSAYLGRREAQNAADGAALAAGRQLAHQYNTGAYNDGAMRLELVDFAQRNGAEDSDGITANAVNTSVAGVYLDENEQSIGVIGSGVDPEGAMGVRSTVFITTPAFFGGIMGRGGYPVQAEATVMLDLACGGECLAPIAAHFWSFTTTVECYNVWNGIEEGQFGWLNWSWQDRPCDEANPCTPDCIVQNLLPASCDSGFLSVGDAVGGTVGVNNSDDVRLALKYYVDTGTPLTVVVWEDQVSYGGNCGMGDSQNRQGRGYVVAGLARMQVLGYSLSNGDPYPSNFDGTACTTIAEPKNKNNGFRISTKFLGYADGEGGNCEVEYGSLLAPTLKE